MITVDSSGALVSVAVPVEPTLPSSSTGSGHAAERQGTPEVASCATTCKVAWDVILFALQPLLVGELLTPVGWAFAFGTFMLGQAGSALANTGNTGKLVNYAINKLTGQSLLDKLEDKAGELLCSGVCSVKLTACCNYTGACFDSDGLCESKCPGGLAHPLAHCDVYINGVKVSTLIPG